MAQRAAPFDNEPVEASAGDARLIEMLRETLDDPGRRASVARLLAGGGEAIEMPGAVLELLTRVVRTLADGDAVTVLPVHAELTTQEAADLLNVSRPYLISVVDAGALPCARTTGGHRRLRLADVLAYKHVRDADRRDALDEMSTEAERLGLRY